MPERDIIVELSGLRSSIVSDALDNLRIKQRILKGFSPATNDMVAVGAAYPITLVNSKNNGNYRLEMMRALDKVPPRSILVINSETGNDYSAWGGNLNKFAEERELGGVMVNGSIRDLNEIARARLPVFSRGKTPIAGTGRFKVTSARAKVKIGSASISKGDLIVADRDGVIIVAKNDIQKVLQESQRVLRAEQASTSKSDPRKFKDRRRIHSF